MPPEQLHLNTEIVSVATVDDGVELVEASGSKHIYDHVILATHSDTTLQLLRRGGGLSDEEEKVLGPWQWSKNEAVLHHDERLMPSRRAAYSAWNYLTYTSPTRPTASTSTTASNVDTVSLTYDMNILQHLPESKHGPVLVTLNPPFPPDPSKVVGRWKYDHPMMTLSSIATQKHLSDIQNRRGISYVGAWTKYGFHEDGFTSAMRLVTAAPFSVKPPFPIRPAHRPVPAPGLTVGFLRVGVDLMEKGRRRVLPLWAWVSWAVVFLLFWFEQLAQALQLQGMTDELVRLRECWVGDEARKTR